MLESRIKLVAALSEKYDREPADVDPRLIDFADKTYRMRVSRLKEFPSIASGEPAWDMCLALFIAAAKGYRLKVSDLCYESHSSPTTALRWIRFLEDEGVITREMHPTDKRVVFVRITPEAMAKMETYLTRMVRLFEGLPSDREQALFCRGVSK